MRLALKKGIPLINIVRRADQAEMLHSLGAEYVLTSAEPGFEKNLSALAYQLKATLILDAIFLISGKDGWADTPSGQ